MGWKKSLMFWRSFNLHERKNVAAYIVGIMFYKFGLEAFNGSVLLLALEVFSKFNKEYSFTGLMLGLNQAAQCLGSIAIAPLIKRWPIRTVLAAAIVFFAILSAILMIIDASTGGTFPSFTIDNKTNTEKSVAHTGDWNPFIIIPFYTLVGISHGMVELIRRVIPRDIVGGDASKLKRMDSLVHVFYEVAGTAGAILASTLVFKFGPNFAPIITPFCFIIAAVCWAFISLPPRTKEQKEKLEKKKQKRNWFMALVHALKSFMISIYRGAAIVFESRTFIWLVPGYAIPLYTHRYLENGLNAIFAREVLGSSNLSQIMTGGSNFGELLGALFVLFFVAKVKTPIPWLRLDALTLLVIWILPWFPIINNDPSTTAWTIGAIWVCVSFGWAAGDVSLAAYIQSSLGEEHDKGDVSPLGAVMAFLYTFYIVLYAVLSYGLGLVVDMYKSNYKAAGLPVSQGIRELLKYIGGVQYTIVCVIILAATFIPKRSFALNPDMIGPSKSDSREEETGSDENSKQKELEKESLKDNLKKSDTDSDENKEDQKVVSKSNASSEKRNGKNGVNGAKKKTPEPADDIESSPNENNSEDEESNSKQTGEEVYTPHKDIITQVVVHSDRKNEDEVAEEDDANTDTNTNTEDQEDDDNVEEEDEDDDEEQDSDQD